MRVEIGRWGWESVGFVAMDLSWGGDRDDLSEIRTNASVKESGLKTEKGDGSSHRREGREGREGGCWVVERGKRGV